MNICSSLNLFTVVFVDQKRPQFSHYKKHQKVWILIVFLLLHTFTVVHNNIPIHTFYQASKKSSSKSSARGSSSSTRAGTSKSSKRSYSAESLLSNEGMVIAMDPASLDVDPNKSGHHHFNKPSDFGWTLGVDQVWIMIYAVKHFIGRKNQFDVFE